MRYTFSVSHANQLKKALQFPFGELIVRTSPFAKWGEIPCDSLSTLAEQVHQTGKRFVLLWDILCHDHDFVRLEKQLSLLKDVPIDAIRFLDPGVGIFLSEKFPQYAQQLILEKNSHNQEAIQGWINVFSYLERIILSNEIPFSVLQTFRSSISVEVELLGLGRIETFYTPRSLLKHHTQQPVDQTLKAHITTEERPNHTMDVLENGHGTFFFHENDLCILHSREELQKAGIDYLRVELYEDHQYELLSSVLQDKDWEIRLKDQWPQKTIRGFFRSNKTDAPLQRLSNRYLKEFREQQIGRVVEASKGKYLVVELFEDWKDFNRAQMHTPEGKELILKEGNIYTLQGERTFFPLQPGFYLLPWVKYAVPSTYLVAR